MQKVLHFSDVSGLRAFVGGLNVEFDDIAFGKSFETFSDNCREMCEHIAAAVIVGDKAKTFCVVKPFHFTACHYKLTYFFLTPHLLE